jgi:group I intron endonuclease
VTCGIYCLTHRASGKRYVGQAVDIERRLKSHRFTKSGHASAICAAVWKYGWDAFEISVLQECERVDLNAAEVRWIAELGSVAPTGYNLTSGGNQLFKVSEETRAKISAAQVGRKWSDAKRAAHSLALSRPEVIERIALAAKAAMTPERRRKISEQNKLMSQETKDKIAVAARNISDETRRKMSEAAKNRAPETREAQRKAMRNASQETREKMAAAKRGRVLSAETCAKLSAAKKGKPRSPQAIEALRNGWAKRRERLQLLGN